METSALIFVFGGIFIAASLLTGVWLRRAANPLLMRYRLTVISMCLLAPGIVVLAIRGARWGPFLLIVTFVCSEIERRRLLRKLQSGL